MVLQANHSGVTATELAESYNSFIGMGTKKADLQGQRSVPLEDFSDAKIRLFFELSRKKIRWCGL